MTRRYTMGSMVGEGQVLDLTNPGCLIESTAEVKKGESLHLKIFLRGLKTPLTIALGVVRWANGSRFGVEFIKMTEDEAAQLTYFVSQFLETFGPVNKDRRGGQDGRQYSAQWRTVNCHE